MTILLPILWQNSLSLYCFFRCFGQQPGTPFKMHFYFILVFLFCHGRTTVVFKLQFVHPFLKQRVFLSRLRVDHVEHTREDTIVPEMSKPLKNLLSVHQHCHYCRSPFQWGTFLLQNRFKKGKSLHTQKSGKFVKMVILMKQKLRAALRANQSAIVSTCDICYGFGTRGTKPF